MFRFECIKVLFHLTICMGVVFSLTSCGSNNPASSNMGTFAIEFSNMVGSQSMSLDTAGSPNFRYTTASGQTFNLSLFGYYISEIKLEGPNGAYYADEMQVGANVADVKGYYHVLESESASKIITLQNVPSGSYNKITFTVGVRESGVQEGAAGGVLDPAAGAWFWNWNAGYIAFALEGTASASTQDDHKFALHVGGWKDVPADQTDGVERFVNNVKTITLHFGTNVSVSDNLAPVAHMTVDALMLLNMADVDFATTNAVHSPKAGQPIAHHIPHVFALDHVHQ